MPLQAYLAAGVFVAGLAAGWTVQGWHYQSKEKDRAEQELADQRLQATARVRREEGVIAAQNESQDRARRFRIDADSARAAADGLRLATAEALRSAAASHAACTERANTLGELLGAVEEAGRGMAQASDRHANDAKTLMDAWPR